jgi:DNA-binding FrmR family transcriptional regulator
MFAITQQINAIVGAINGLQTQVLVLDKKVSELSTQQRESGAADVSQKINSLSGNIEDVKKSISKVQVDVVGKHNDIKKDLDSSKKEIKLLETTLTRKMEQSINKTVKDRTDLVSAELKSFVETTLKNYMDESDKEEEHV